MDRNVELKARVPSLAPIRKIAEALSDQPPALLEQEDTYFRCDSGRLKVRRLSRGLGELIFYCRASSEGPQESRFLRARTADPEPLATTLALAYGVRGVVRKRRTLYLVGQTRVHLDEVERLGSFVELEVVMRPGQQLSDGERIAELLRERLGIARRQLVEVSYIDLLEALGKSARDEPERAGSPTQRGSCDSGKTTAE